jgi:hypothetical protein
MSFLIFGFQICRVSGRSFFVLLSLVWPILFGPLVAAKEGVELHNDSFSDKGLDNVTQLVDGGAKTLDLPVATKIFLKNSRLAAMSIRRQLSQSVYPYVSNDMILACSRIAVRDFGIKEKIHDEVRELTKFAREVKETCMATPMKPDDVYVSLVRFFQAMSSSDVMDYFEIRYNKVLPSQKKRSSAKLAGPLMSSPQSQ